jgi:hypothetical protein
LTDEKKLLYLFQCEEYDIVEVISLNIFYCPKIVEAGA